ncbi:MAG: hypothetical protein ACLPID_02940 [Beijerinckiaceae bacterium]
MTNIKEIEKAIAKLPREELAEFRAWFEEFDARLFDAAIERDIEAGKLDRFAEEALTEHKKSRTREL